MLVPVDALARTFGVRPTGVLHVGAHEAEEWDDYQRFGWGPVIWVEMLPEKAELLRAKFAAEKKVTIIVAKGRNIGLGEVELWFDGDKMKFYEVSHDMSIEE